MPLYNYTEFMEHFCLTRVIAVVISQQETRSLSGVLHIRLYKDVADRFNISVGVLRTIIKILSYFLGNLPNQIVTLPLINEEKLEILPHFQDNGFPEVIVVIGGSHLKIDPPAFVVDSYLNIKHFFSIQVGRYLNNFFLIT